MWGEVLILLKSETRALSYTDIFKFSWHKKFPFIQWFDTKTVERKYLIPASVKIFSGFHSWLLSEKQYVYIAYNLRCYVVLITGNRLRSNLEKRKRTNRTTQRTDFAFMLPFIRLVITVSSFSSENLCSVSCIIQYVRLFPHLFPLCLWRICQKLKYVCPSPVFPINYV